MLREEITVEKAFAHSIHINPETSMMGVLLLTRERPGALNPLSHDGRIWYDIRTAIDLGVLPRRAIHVHDSATLQKMLAPAEGKSFEIRSEIAEKIHKLVSKAVNHLKREAADIVETYLRVLIADPNDKRHVIDALVKFIEEGAEINDDSAHIWINRTHELETALHYAFGNDGGFHGKLWEILHKYSNDSAARNDPLIRRYNEGLVQLSRLLQAISNLMGESAEVVPVHLLEIVSARNDIRAEPAVVSDLPRWMNGNHYVLAVLRFPTHAKFLGSDPSHGFVLHA